MRWMRTGWRVGVVVAASGCAGTGPLVQLEVANIADADALGTGGPTVRFSPGVWTVSADRDALFALGAPASAALEDLAERGMSQGLYDEARAAGLARRVGAVEALSTEDYAVISLGPGEGVRVSFPAVPGDQLSLAMMLTESNDTFAGVHDVPLFAGGGALLEGALAGVALFDAGTEVNEPLGQGATQAPRQDTPDGGVAEGGVVTVEAGTDAQGNPLPVAGDLLQLTLSLDAG